MTAPSPAKRPGWRDEPSPARLDPRRPDRAEILARHARACAEGRATYVDPATGYQVMTAPTLAARGECCDSGCRHCPWAAAGPTPPGSGEAAGSDGRSRSSGTEGVVGSGGPPSPAGSEDRAGWDGSSSPIGSGGPGGAGGTRPPDPAAGPQSRRVMVQVGDRRRQAGPAGVSERGPGGPWWSPRPTPPLAVAAFWALLAAAAGLTVAVRRRELLPGERAVIRWVRDVLDGPLGPVSGVLDVAFTDLAAPAVFFVLLGLVAWRWGPRAGAVLFVAGGASGLTKLADLAARPRPTDELTWGEVVFGRGGYPSGHIVYGVLVFGTIAYLAGRSPVPSERVAPGERGAPGGPVGRRRGPGGTARPAPGAAAASTRGRAAGSRPAPVVRATCLVLVVVMAPARLVELEHWPADLLAGYLLAVPALMAVVWADRRLLPGWGERGPAREPAVPPERPGTA